MLAVAVPLGVKIRGLSIVPVPDQSPPLVDVALTVILTWPLK